MNKGTKVLLIFLIVTLLLTIGLVVLAGIGVGVWAVHTDVLAQATPPDFVIGITSPIPSGQAFSNGFIELELSLPTGVFTKGNVLVYLDGVMKYSFKNFPFNLQIPTQGLADGSHTVAVTAVSTNNTAGTGEIIVLVQDPGLMLVSIDFPLDISPGMLITITLELSRDASHFVANYSSIFGQSTIMNSTIQNGSTLIGTILVPDNLTAVEQFYTIPLVVYSFDGRTLIIPGIDIFFQLGATNPFSIAEGIVDMKSFPQTEASDSVNSTLNITLPPTTQVSITTGQTIQIPLEIPTGTGASELLVGFKGYGQHFILPISSLLNGTSGRRRSTREATQAVSFELTLPMGAVDSVETIDIQLRLRNMVGELGPIQIISAVTTHSQAGTLHFRLTWDLEVDMDIHVIDPNSEEIFWGARTSTLQEGFLDLDSNPACNIDNIKTENIYYSLAVSGQYTVRVDLWDACSITETINFELLVVGCDMSQTISGSFLPSEADRGAAGSGREVLTYNAACSEYLASGVVCYMTPTSRHNPLGSVVRVVDDAGTIFGTSQVERDFTDERRGVFSVPYQPTDVVATVYIEFLSTNNKIKVTDHTDENIHVYRVPEGISPSTEVISTRDVVISTEDGSGAFHIMVTMSRALALYLSYGGQTADYPLIVDWENGEYAKGTDYPVSYFSGGIISMGGHESDPDQFDDSVLLHEFGHLINARTGAVITGGGPHDGSPITPNFAFSEGYATYLGQKIIGNLVYCDGWCQDLTNLPARYLGTTAANDASSGDISENLVASVAFKLDNEIGLGAMMCQSLTDPNKLLLEANYNSLGTLDAVDFSDMVSLVVCPLDDAQKTPATTILTDNDLPWIAEAGFCTPSD